MKIQHLSATIVTYACLFHEYIMPVEGQAPSLYFPGGDNDVYDDWVNSTSYTKSTFIESTSSVTGEGVAIHWDTTESAIQLAVVAKATGWAAFGLAESGSMRGADIVMYIAENDTLVDSYVLDQLVKPFPDECQSWELINSVVDGGFIIFEAKRLLNTSDAQDRVIIDDSLVVVPPTRVIASWGNTSEPSYHGRNTACGSIRFFGSSDTASEEVLFAEAMSLESEGNFTVGAQNFTIPSDVVTTYQRFCFAGEDLLALGVPLNEDLHTIGIEPVLDPETRKYVHHFILYAFAQPWNNSLDCEEYPAIEVAYSWAPGDLPLILPPNVGGPLGAAGFQSFALEVHYNNADLDTNVVDNSGVRIFYTSVKREFDLGIFQTGDPFVALRDEMAPVSPNGGLAQHSFECDDACLGTHLNGSVTVFREHLHMHMTGVSMVNYHIRNERILRQARVDYWDFEQQGDLGVVQSPYTINSGDTFHTVCNYNAPNTTAWGLASEEEMCIAFLYYYPRQLATDGIPITCGLGVDEVIPECGVSYTLTPDFTSEAQLQRSFGASPEMCPNVVTGIPTAPTSSPVQQDLTSFAVMLPSNIVVTMFHAIFIWIAVQM